MKEKPRILVMYGYHPEEEFAIGVGASLAKARLGDNIKVRIYSGKSDHPNRLPTLPGDPKYYPYQRQPSFPNQRKFIMSYFPLDYVIDIHNGFPSRSYPQDGPAAMVGYHSWKRVEENIEEAIVQFCLSRSYNATWHFVPQVRYGIKGLHEFEIELMPPLVTRKQSIGFAKGVIEIIASTGH